MGYLCKLGNVYKAWDIRDQITDGQTQGTHNAQS